MVRPSESGQGTSTTADNDYVLTFEPVAPDCDDDVICVAEKRYKDGVRPPPRPTPIDWERNDCEIIGEVVTNTQNGPSSPEVVYVGENLSGLGGWRLRLPRAPAAAARLHIEDWPADGQTGRAIAMSLEKAVPAAPQHNPAQAAPPSEQNSHNTPPPHDAVQAVTLQAATEDRNRDNDDMAPIPVPVGRVAVAVAATPITPDTPSVETNSLAAEDEDTGAVLGELVKKVESGEKREEETESETSFKADQDKPAVGFTQHTQVEHTQILAVGDDDCMLVGELVPIEHVEPMAPDNEEDCVVMKTVVRPERAHAKKRTREEGMGGYDPKRVKMELEELRAEEARRMDEKASKRTRLASLYPQVYAVGWRWDGDNKRLVIFHHTHAFFKTPTQLALWHRKIKNM